MFGNFVFPHYEKWIDFRKTKRRECETNYLFHEELSRGESADIAKIQAGLLIYSPFL